MAPPKIAPDAIVRERIDQWLARNAKVPMRALIAPSGFGKTVALAQYMRRAACVYVRVRPGDTADELRAKISDALGMTTPVSHERLLTLLRDAAPVELIVDALDLAADDGIDEINALVHGSDDDVRLLIASCSTHVLRSPRLIAQGLAALLDARMLAYTGEDVLQHARGLGVDAASGDAAALAGFASGWPAAAAAVVRGAAAQNVTLRSAMASARSLTGPIVHGALSAELARAPHTLRALFGRAISGDELTDPQWCTLRDRGLFVIDDQAGLRLHPLVAERNAHVPLPHAAPAMRTTPLHVRLFGRLEVSFSGTRIDFVRRRDLLLIKALALMPDGSATREEIIGRFWPRVDANIAYARLRTSCSNIRRALAARVGTAAVGRYFITGPRIGLDFRNVVVDARRFDDQLSAGDEAMRRHDIAEALSLYRAAERAYGGHIQGTEDDASGQEMASRYRTRYDALLAKLTAMARAQGDVASAMHYASLSEAVTDFRVRMPAEVR